MSAPVAFLTRQDGTMQAREPVLMPCETCDLAEVCGPGNICPEYIPDLDDEEDAEKQIAAWAAKE